MLSRLKGRRLLKGLVVAGSLSALLGFEVVKPALHTSLHQMAQRVELPVVRPIVAALAVVTSGGSVVEARPPQQRNAGKRPRQEPKPRTHESVPTR